MFVGIVCAELFPSEDAGDDVSEFAGGYVAQREWGLPQGLTQDHTHVLWAGHAAAGHLPRAGEAPTDVFPSKQAL